MTVMPAWMLQLAKNGMLKPDFDADLVVFNPEKIIDKATFGPGVCNTPPAGIDRVYVMGRLACAWHAVSGQQFRAGHCPSGAAEAATAGAPVLMISRWTTR